MSKKELKIASTYKLLCHQDRLQRYILGEEIFPVTLELGVTTRCNRQCADCPSGRSQQLTDLPIDMIEELFHYVAGKTPGLIVTGGEPTLHPKFFDILHLAKKIGKFEEISVISNGSLLSKESIRKALSSFATAVRVSIYDWKEHPVTTNEELLQSIKELRQLAKEGPHELTIGASILTGDKTYEELFELCGTLHEKGIAWVYFHPSCTKDIQGTTTRLGKIDETTKALMKLQRQNKDKLQVFFLRDRYEQRQPKFSKYHSAHFICVIAADGKNYLSSESKFLHEYLLADLSQGVAGLFSSSKRKERIAKINSKTYELSGGRNRGVLYNDLIERVIERDLTLDELADAHKEHEFLMPAII